MNSKEAKRIPLSDVLAQIGLNPHHQAKGEFWYFSPFRDDCFWEFLEPKATPCAGIGVEGDENQTKTDPSGG